MKLNRDTLVLSLLLVLMITVTDYKQPKTSDYIGIASTIILSIALIINVISLWKKGRDEK